MKIKTSAAFYSQPLARLSPIVFLLFTNAFMFNPYLPYWQSALVVSAIVLVGLNLQKGAFQAVNFRFASLLDINRTMLIYFFTVCSMGALQSVDSTWLVEKQMKYSLAIPLSSDRIELMKLLFQTAFVTAIGEELYFRSFVYTQLQRAGIKGKWIFISISALLYCMLFGHLAVSGIVVGFCWGIIMALVYHRYTNITINIVLHSAVEGTLLVLGYYKLLPFKIMI